MARSKGTMKVSANIEPRIGAPLDARMVVSTLADLTTSGNFPYPYVGMLVAVQATNKLYMYNGGTITSSNAWDEVGGSTLSGDVGSATNPVYVNDGVITETTYSLGASVPSDAVFTDTTYESKSAASGGTDVSLVTTGEKYSWNNKSNLTLGETSTSAYYGDKGKTAYDHSQSTHAPTTSKSATQSGTDLSLVTTGEKYTWNNKSNLTIGTTSTTAAAGNHNHDGTYLKSVPTADADTLGGIKVGFETDGNDRAVQVDSNGNAYVTQKDTTYESKSASSGGTDLSLVTTGEKYTWNNKSSLTIGTTATTAAAGNHNHDGTYLKSVPTADDDTIGGFKTGYTTSGNNRAVMVDSNGKAYVTQKDTTYTFDGTYNASTNKAATVSTVTTAIGNLDGTISGTAGASKTLTAFSQTDGKVSATFGNISITKSQVSDFPSSMPASDVSDWAKASSKPTYTASEVGAIASTEKGAASGVATLDANGKITSSQLPSYVDDVVEYAGTSLFPTTGESGVIYVDTTTNKTYRWSGTEYVIIGNSLALGTTSSTAYRGDYGNTAYTHATDSNRLTTAKTEGLYKIATTAHGHIKSVTAVAKADITGLGIPAQDTTYSSLDAASGGTDVSLVTTGEKYTWNNKSTLALGTTATTAAKGNHTHTASLATDTGTSAITLASAGKYKLTAGGGSVIFTMPTIPSYSSQAAASGGTDLSLVTTGEKYTWNNKSSLTIGTTSSTAAAGNHTHTATLATDTGTSSITLASAGKYKLTAGGSSVIFTMPTSTNLSIGTTSTTAAAGNHSHTTSLASDTGTATVTLSANSTYKLTAGGTNVIFKTPTDTTYSSKSAASGGTDVSLVTTGEKYTWNNKSSLTLGTTSTTAYRGDYGNTAYTHSQSTHAPTTSKSAASGGTETSLVTTGEKYTWNSKAAGDHTHSTYALKAGDTITGTLILSKTQDASGIANNKPALIIGGTDTQAHIEIDNNEILAKSNGTTSTTLYLQDGNGALGLCGSDYSVTNPDKFRTAIGAGTSSLSLGTTSSTAFRGDYGNTAYTHSQSTHAPTTSSAAVSGGTTLSLVTTGEKYTWNNKSNLTIGTTSTTAAAGNHSHTTSIATSTGTNQITLAASTKYAITAGGNSYVFTTPPNTTYSGATGTQLGLIRISASGDVLSIYTSAS